jgi:CRP/FNR family transcriptional regulator
MDTNNITQLNSIFEPALLEEILQHGRFLEVKEGDIILNAGDSIRVIPIVLEGTIKVSRQDDEGNELLLYYITSAESCAMTFTCCMESSPSEIKAVAEEATKLMAVPVSIMDAWMMKYPTWKRFVMHTIRRRFAELLETIDQIAFQQLDERLIHYLRRKSAATGSTLINLSHEQIAAEMATSRVVISRLLKKLEQDHKVLLYRHQIKLLREL